MDDSELQDEQSWMIIPRATLVQLRPYISLTLRNTSLRRVGGLWVGITALLPLVLYSACMPLLFSLAPFGDVRVI